MKPLSLSEAERTVTLLVRRQWESRAKRHRSRGPTKARPAWEARLQGTLGGTSPAGSQDASAWSPALSAPGLCHLSDTSPKLKLRGGRMEGSFMSFPSAPWKVPLASCWPPAAKTSKSERKDWRVSREHTQCLAVPDTSKKSVLPLRLWRIPTVTQLTI